MNILQRLIRSVDYRFTIVNNKFLLQKSKRAIQAYHNKYQEKRCFIIGNGPSLRTEDLERLKGEICFGTHRIYKIFNDTSWRPTFYCAQDYKFIAQTENGISDMEAKEKFIAMVPCRKYPRIKNAVFVKMNPKQFYPNFPDFSEDISKEMFEGMTVTYMCIQFAVYMGFSEIYLLGIDHNYSVEMNPDGSIKMTEGIKDHFSNDDTCTNVPQTYKSSLAYCAARKYADQHNVKIFNATRGGKLEAFERVDFDTLFTV